MPPADSNFLIRFTMNVLFSARTVISFPYEYFNKNIVLLCSSDPNTRLANSANDIGVPSNIQWHGSLTLMGVTPYRAC
jgi:hypothetical protein